MSWGVNRCGIHCIVPDLRRRHHRNRGERDGLRAILSTPRRFNTDCQGQRSHTTSQRGYSAACGVPPQESVPRRCCGVWWCIRSMRLRCGDVATQNPVEVQKERSLTMPVPTQGSGHQHVCFDGSEGTRVASTSLYSSTTPCSARWTAPSCAGALAQSCT